jgi:hypothetical protein
MVSKIVVPKMTSNLESPFAAGNADTASCTRNVRNEVSSRRDLAVLLSCFTALFYFIAVVQFEAR